MENQNRRIRYRDRIYTVEELQERLQSELERLHRQLDSVDDADEGSRKVVAKTYRDMIKQRQELFESLV